MDNEKPENSSLLLQIDKNVDNFQDTKSFKIKGTNISYGSIRMDSNEY